jgi:hypothetical protein
MTREIYKDKLNQLLACGFVPFDNSDEMGSFLKEIPKSIRERITDIDKINNHLWLE